MPRLTTTTVVVDGDAAQVVKAFLDAVAASPAGLPAQPLIKVEVLPLNIEDESGIPMTNNSIDGPVGAQIAAILTFEDTV